MSHAEESTPHVLAGCSALAQTKYLARHNSLWVAKKTDNILSWFSPTEPKPVDENQRAKAYWDELVYAKNTEVRVNTIDVRKINKDDKKVTLLEMSCPWMENREAKESEKIMRNDNLVARFPRSTVQYDGSIWEFNSWLWWIMRVVLLNQKRGNILNE